jgi:hypothetical protein
MGPIPSGRHSTMALIKDGKLAVDAYVDVSSADIVPPTGSVIVGLAQWQAHTAE